MQGIGEEQEPLAGKFLGCEHRSRASAHRAPAEDEGLQSDFAAGVRSHGGDAFLQARHGVRMAGPFLAVKEVEADNVEPAPAQVLGNFPATGSCSSPIPCIRRGSPKSCATRILRGSRYRSYA